VLRKEDLLQSLFQFELAGQGRRKEAWILNLQKIQIQVDQVDLMSGCDMNLISHRSILRMRHECET
jgi:hypothetical protein